MDWEAIIEAEDAADGEDIIYLPQKEVIALDGNFQKEISYEWEDPNDKTTVVRREKKIEIIETKKRISRAAKNRKKEWIKFGAVSKEPKGSLEKGITSHRPDDVPFLWNGMSLEQINRQKAIRRRDLTSSSQNKRGDLSSKLDDEEKKQQQPEKKRTYQIKKDYLMDEIFEIRISNLPDWTEWAHIKELIDAFYRNYLGVQYPPKYKIRMFTTRHEQEKNAIVEFESERYAKEAIKELNGHQYEYHILKVEKSIPRPPR